ncbi:hypothetical protein ABZP36_033510 [Zizania latifolia]
MKSLASGGGGASATKAAAAKNTTTAPSHTSTAIPVLLLHHWQARPSAAILVFADLEFLGQQLDSLTLREVRQLEHQIDISLRNIQSKKNILLINSISELRQSLATSAYAKGANDSLPVEVIEDVLPIEEQVHTVIDEVTDSGNTNGGESFGSKPPVAKKRKMTVEDPNIAMVTMIG